MIKQEVHIGDQQHIKAAWQRSEVAMMREDRIQ